MAAQTYNFKDHITGDTFKGITFHIELNDVSLDLTDFEITMQLRKEYLGKVMLELSTEHSEPGITITDAVNGEFKINDQIIAVYPYNYLYDIELRKEDYVKTWISGTWKILPDVTRRLEWTT